MVKEIAFTAYPATQQSQVTQNTIVSAGNSAFAGLGFDPLQGRSAGAPDFTGASITNNVLWSGPNTHFVIGLTLGTRAWFASGSIGYGAEATDNTTAGIQTLFAEGISVSGMTSATVQGNNFVAALIPQSWTNCPVGNVLASISAGLAGGSIQSYSDVEVNGCMSDYSPAGSTPSPSSSTSSTIKSTTSPSSSQEGAAADGTSSSTGGAQGGGGGLSWLDLIVLAGMLNFRCVFATRMRHISR